MLWLLDAHPFVPMNLNHLMTGDVPMMTLMTLLLPLVFVLPTVAFADADPPQRTLSLIHI